MKRLISMLLTLAMLVSLLPSALAAELPEGDVLEETILVEDEILPEEEETVPEEETPEDAVIEEETPEEPVIDEELPEEALDEESESQEAVIIIDEGDIGWPVVHWSVARIGPNEEVVLTLSAKDLNSTAAVALDEDPPWVEYKDIIQKVALNRISSISLAKKNSKGELMDAGLFQEYPKLTQFVNDGKLAEVGKRTFYWTPLEGNITFGSALTTIGEEAFYATNITGLDLSACKNLKLIDKEAFNCHELVTVKLPTGASFRIGEQAFAGCESLQNMELPEGITSIGKWAFGHCNLPAHLVIPESCKNIGSASFGCVEGTNLIEIKGEITELPSDIVRGSDINILVVPDTVATLKDGTYPFESDIEALELVCWRGEKDLSSISGTDYFENYIRRNSMTNLAEIRSAYEVIFHIPCENGYKLGLSLKHDDQANTYSARFFAVDQVPIGTQYRPINFSWAKNVLNRLVSVTFDGVDVYQPGLLKNSTALSQLDLGSRMTEIAPNFLENSGLSGKVILPSNIKTIHGYAFKGSKIQEMAFQNPDLKTKDYALADMTSLTQLILPMNWTVVYDFLCYGDSALESVYFPASVKNVGYASFLFCNELKNACWGGSKAAELNDCNYPLEKVTNYYNVPVECMSYSLNVTSSITSDGIKLSWNRPGWETQTKVECLSRGVYSTIAVLSGKNSYVDTAVSSGSSYSYRITIAGPNGLVLDNFGRGHNSAVYLAQPEVKLENRDNGIKLSWEAVRGATDYVVYISSRTGWRKLGETSGLTYNYGGLLTKMESNTIYTFTVRAKNSTSQSCYDKSFSIRHLAQPDVTVTNKNGSISVTWKPVEGATKYLVYTRENGKWKKLGETIGTSYNHTVNLVSGNNYYFTIRATNGTVQSSFGTFATKYLSQPNVKLENQNGSIKLSWSSITGANKYAVYQKVNGVWNKLGDTTGTSYVYDSALTSGGNYYFTVRAINGSYGSTYGTFGIKYLAQPAVKLENKKDSVRIYWGSVGGAVKYNVYIRANDKWSNIGTTSDTSFVYSGAMTSGSNYSFTVKAINGSYGSTYGSFGIKYLAAPVMSSAVRSGSNVVVKWESVPGAVDYRIYRKVDNGGWSSVCTVSGTTSYTDVYNDASALVKGHKYTYTVKAINGSYISGYDSTGKALNYN